MQIVMIGPPGCGKGTQSTRLADQFAIAHLSTGEMLREAMDRGTELGHRISEVITRGDLVSDELVMELVAERITERDCCHGCLFDGVPRTVAQAAELDWLLAERGRQVSLALEIDVDDDELMRRVELRARNEGRKDDTPEALRRRLEVYHRESLPILAHYRRMRVLKRINGVGSEAEVAARIQQVLPK